MGAVGFNNVLMRDPILAILRGDVSTPEGAVRRFDKNHG